MSKAIMGSDLFEPLDASKAEREAQQAEGEKKDRGQHVHGVCVVVGFIVPRVVRVPVPADVSRVRRDRCASHLPVQPPKEISHAGTWAA